MRKDVMLRPSSVSPHSGYFLLPAYPGPWHVRIPGRDTSGQTALILMDMPAGDTGLAGWEPPVHFDQGFSLPFRFIGKHGTRTFPIRYRKRICRT